METTGDTLRRIERKLLRDARSAASGRGHRVGRFVRVFGWGIGAAFSATCRDCGAWMRIETTPPPNGITIGGDAVALSCTSSS